MVWYQYASMGVLSKEVPPQELNHSFVWQSDRQVWSYNYLPDCALPNDVLQLVLAL